MPFKPSQEFTLDNRKVIELNGPETKACIFGAFIIIAYAIHQVTVGGDGIIFASICTTVAAIGGYVIRLSQEGK
jgi:hypothetical protein